MVKREIRKQQITEERQQQLLTAAIEVFSIKGFAATTVPEIARAAKVSVGTIYNYYPGKKELFMASIRNLILTIPLLNYIDGMPQADITETLKKIMRNRFDLLNTGVASRMPSLMGDIQRDPDLKELWVDQFIQPFMSRMEKIYSTMMESGKFRRMQPSVATRVIGGMILGFVMLRIMEGEKSPIAGMPQDEVADAIAGILMHGIYNSDGDKGSKRSVL